MNLFFDECVSASAAVHFRRTTRHATCHTRDVNMSGASDADVLAHCHEFDHTLITIIGRDFRKLCENPDQLHPGLIIIPSIAMTNQICFIKAALARINQEAPPDTSGLDGKSRRGGRSPRCCNACTIARGPCP